MRLMRRLAALIRRHAQDRYTMLEKDAEFWSLIEQLHGARPRSEVGAARPGQVRTGQLVEEARSDRSTTCELARQTSSTQDAPGPAEVVAALDDGRADATEGPDDDDVGDERDPSLGSKASPPEEREVERATGAAKDA
jgi:hypothetical protein